MNNYETKAIDIVRYKNCSFNPLIQESNIICKRMCPLVASIDEDKYYYRTPDNNWFCANGNETENYDTTSNDIVRCKDCINNPANAKGFTKYACPFDEDYSVKSVESIDGSWNVPDGNWFCANGMK